MPLPNYAAIVTFTPAVGISSIFSEDVRDEVESLASGWTDIQIGIVNGVVDGVYWVYDLYNELRCFDFDGVRDRFKRLFRNAESADWEVPQGRLFGSVFWDFSFINYLRDKQEKGLTTKNDAMSYCSLPENNCNRQEHAWKETAKNLDVLLAV